MRSCVIRPHAHSWPKTPAGQAAPPHIFRRCPRGWSDESYNLESAKLTAVAAAPRMPPSGRTAGAAAKPGGRLDELAGPPAGGLGLPLRELLSMAGDAAGPRSAGRFRQLRSEPIRSSVALALRVAFCESCVTCPHAHHWPRTPAGQAAPPHIFRRCPPGCAHVSGLLFTPPRAMCCEPALCCSMIASSRLTGAVMMPTSSKCNAKG